MFLHIYGVSCISKQRENSTTVINYCIDPTKYSSYVVYWGSLLSMIALVRKYEALETHVGSHLDYNAVITLEITFCLIALLPYEEHLSSFFPINSRPHLF